MADQSDVETALVALAADTLYPNGPAAVSATGATTRIYRGWPNQAALDADLAAGIVNVTVFPDAGSIRNTTRYPAEYEITARVAATLTVTSTATTATFAGAAAPGQIAGLLVDGVPVVHRLAPGDTPAIVAAILADALRPARIALAAGPTISVPGAALLIARVVADQPARKETRRQEQSFRLSCWCADPAIRDATAGALDAALSDIMFIALPDGTAGRLRFRGAAVRDQSEDAALYRRDLLYTVEYATTLTVDLPTMLFGETTYAANTGPVIATLYG